MKIVFKKLVMIGTVGTQRMSYLIPLGLVMSLKDLVLYLLLTTYLNNFGLQEEILNVEIFADL